ncbi:MAG: tagatose 1,6-diphosphate aldolase [Chloroflexi bacterium]|nr:tagatose 1,6-diphosphate aldolase [Chloroflexota bacterium]
MISIGKFRHLTQCATRDGHFMVLAIDHRANLRDALSAARGVPVDDREVGEFKRDVIQALGDQCSGILGDPSLVVGQGIASGMLSSTPGLIAPLEVTNYQQHPSEREIQFIPDWNVEKAKRAGLSGIKLLIYFHPLAGTAGERLRLISLLAGVCSRFDLPLFLEPILFDLPGEDGHDLKVRLRHTVSMLRAMVDCGVDILKIEFPVRDNSDNSLWQWDDALGIVNEACGEIPWVLLSGGVDSATFKQQVSAACQAGCSGIMVGRALWNPAVKAVGQDGRIRVLHGKARSDLSELAAIVKQHGVPFWDRTRRPNGDTDWFRDYPGFVGGK